MYDQSEKTMTTVTKTTWQPLLNTCADLADEISRHYFQNNVLNVIEKGDSTPVTQADQEIEEKIRELVAKQHPELEVYGEEHGQCDENAPLKLIIDPIDGTQNFIRGIPFFGSLLAIEENGKIISGSVSCPHLQERWWANKGEGAVYRNPFKEEVPCTVSKVNDLSQCQSFHAGLFGYEATGSNTEKLLALLKKTKRQRGFGDFYPHMLVAMGSGEFAVDFNLKPWDMAPLKIIVEEAGGKLTDINGNDSIYNGTLLSSNTLLHQTVISELK